MGLELTVWFP